MKSQSLIDWYRNPGQMGEDEVSALERLLKTYPCLVLAQMLRLKAMPADDLENESMLFRTALMVPQRRVLRDFMLGQALPESPSAAAEEPVDDGFSLIDSFLSSQGASTDGPTTPPGLAQAYPTYSLEKEHGDGSDVSLPDDAASRFLDNPQESIPRAADEEQQVIDMFEAESQRIPDISFTETLAIIYLKQKKYAQALEIFKSLELKNPEKSIYFADQIRFLEKLIKHLNK